MGYKTKGTFSYLRRYYFDDEKLKQLAISEFVRAMRGGRLIAFTGSMTTKQFGYPKWGDLLDRALVIAAKDLGDADVQRLIPALRQVGRRDRRFDARVAFSAVAQMLDHRDATGEATQKAIGEVANLFTRSKSGIDRRNTIISALFEDLGIDRVVTTNYDLELEAHAMRLAPLGRPEPTWSPLDSIKALKADGWLYHQGEAEEGHSLVLNLPNGDRIVSDVMLRERPEALIEFAIGCPENDKHIFHLHGRADQPKELILSYRDYDRLYRRRSPAKLPFEHALRILFAGNPVLFVGLGMSEPELNKTLSEFVGDHPYLRKTPAFLIWNGLKDEPPRTIRGRNYPALSADRRRAVFRLDMLHRLGILTLFPEDLEPGAKGLPKSKSDVENLRRSLLRLTGQAVVAQQKRLQSIPPERWRHALSRIKRAFEPEPPGIRARSAKRIINTWNVEWTIPGADLAPEHGDSVNSNAFITVILRPDGASKTGIATQAAKRWTREDPSQIAVILNFNMRIDTDSSIAFIGDLLRYDPTKTDKQNLSRMSSRQGELERLDTIGLSGRAPLLIVLKGLERIFDVNGHPLSAEFDQFLRTVVHRNADAIGHIRLVVIATERVRRYFEGLSTLLPVAASSAGQPPCRSTDPAARLSRVAGAPLNSAETPQMCFEELTAAEAAKATSAYLKRLRDRHSFGVLEEAKLETRVFSDYAAKRRTLYRAILTPGALSAQGVRDPDLALEIVTVMSFIGQPIERGGLFHAPSIQKRLGGEKKNIQARRKAFNRAFDDLVRKSQLVKEINKRPGPRRPEHHRRYTVHLSLQTEIRDRNGIPLSDSILSTAYNMSLFSAQPADGALPEAEVHDELGRLVDWMVGAHKDEPLDPAFSGKNLRGAPHVVAALRAAVSLVRGLYSTSALLSVDRGDRLVSDEREGLLSEHAQRLERILRAFDRVWRARGPSSEGAEPLYPDELVWLHNERGVVKLAQGDLYEARFSFDEADRLNRLYVEFGDKSHNWRRITLNQVVVDIERGRLQSAEDRMNEIEQVLGASTANRIRSRYLDAQSMRRIRFDPVASHEDILAMALITGYRGLTGHLRGELDVARINFDRAIRVLQRMDEQRALALFRRHKASLHGDLGDPDALRRESRLAVSGAESVRQLDIVYAGRLLEACYLDDKGSSTEKREALRAALEALDYATLADMHRLTIEAQSRLAWAKFHSGDYDAALEHASDAMATATRYGMTLYKISLRTLLGQILIRRGNGEAGRVLVQSAINGALRVGYQRAIGSARQVLAANRM